MASTLGYALLSLLARADRTGYDLQRAMREPVGFFWHASHSQIYPELARLEAAGLVRHRVVAGRGPRDTKRYQITATGRRELAAWVVRTPDPVPDRDVLMLQVYSSWTADPAATATMAREQLARHRAALARYEQIAAEFTASAHGLDDPADPRFSAYATLRAGLSYERHRIGWLEWLLNALERPPSGP